jgi:PAS domain S-box-containing protein
MGGPFDLLEHVPIPAYVFRVEGDDFVLEEVNPAARAQNPAIAGMRGRSMNYLYQDQVQALEDARRAMAEKTTVVREMAVRRYDRTEATMLVELSFVYGEPDRLIMFMRDVATPPIAEAALRESETRYRTLVDALPDAVLLRGADGRLLACNDVAVRLYGAHSQFDLLGTTEAPTAKKWTVRTENGAPVDVTDLPSRRVMATGVAEVGHVYEVTAEGESPRWYRVAAQPIRGSSGAINGSVTMFTDITDRFEAQKALRESAARLDVALSAAKSGIWEMDAETRVGFSSANLNAIFKLPLGIESFAEFLANVHPDDRDPITSAMERALAANQGDVIEQEFRILGKDAVTRWARAFARAQREDRKLRLIGTIMDVTEQHHLEEELRRAHRLESIGRLAGGIAHDFNNLLAAMIGSVELIEDVCPPAAREDLATIRHGAARGTELTRQLLAFARKQPVSYRDVDLATMLANVERMLRRLVGAGVELVITNSKGVRVRADPSLIEQVLVNLVVNAKEAMPNGGRIEVLVGTTLHAAPGSGPPKTFALLQVSDSGVGMDDDTRAKIFDPFFTTKTTGTGLGLASSYGIVKQHGGHIHVDTRPGHGTRFRVLLPLSPNEATEEASPSTSPMHGKGCILVVDDEELVRNTTVRMVKSLGYDVLIAGSGEEALACADRHHGYIDALVCDVSMPGMDGPAVARELRRRRPGLRVLFVSGYSGASDDPLVTSTAFLGKPYTLSDLAAKLHQVLSE